MASPARRWGRPLSRLAGLLIFTAGAALSVGVVRAELGSPWWLFASAPIAGLCFAAEFVLSARLRGLTAQQLLIGRFVWFDALIAEQELSAGPREPRRPRLDRNEGAAIEGSARPLR